MGIRPGGSKNQASAYIPAPGKPTAVGEIEPKPPKAVPGKPNPSSSYTTISKRISSSSSLNNPKPTLTAPKGVTPGLGVVNRSKIPFWSVNAIEFTGSGIPDIQPPPKP